MVARSIPRGEYKKMKSSEGLESPLRRIFWESKGPCCTSLVTKQQRLRWKISLMDWDPLWQIPLKASLAGRTDASLCVTCFWSPGYGFFDSSLFRASLVAQLVKNLPAMQDTWVQSLGWEDLLEKGMATHSSILAWRIPWSEKPGGLQSMGSQRAYSTDHQIHTSMCTFQMAEIRKYILTGHKTKLLQEGGPLPGPETGLLSNTRKWIVRGDTCWQSKRFYWERAPGWRAGG